MTHEVVVGFDGSETAAAAVAWAAAEASARRARLRLLHAFLPPVGGVGLGYGTLLPAGAIDTLRDSAQEHLAAEAAKVAAEHPGLDVASTVLVGNPASALLEEAETADLVVVGSRGLGGFRGLLVGSTGTQVAAHAECPVVVVRGSAPPDADAVVVGVDGSEHSVDALRFAFAHADRHGLGITAVHAWDVPTYDVLAAPTGPPPASIDELTDDAMRETAEALAGFRADYPSVDVTEVVVKAPTVNALLEAARGAALIVVGSRGRGEFLGALLGSVSQGVVSRAEIPVAVVGGARR